jgi:hypothetical protein
LQNSGPLPLPFLRGVGLPDNFIDYLPSLPPAAVGVEGADHRAQPRAVRGDRRSRKAAVA